MALYETRQQWGSQQSDPAGYQIGRVSELIVHHFWKPHVPATATHSDERSTMRSVQRNHTNEQGWDDIAYQWVVFGSGRAYEGRGWFRTGAHTHGRNSKSVGIAFAINGDDHTPTDKAWETARQLAAEGIQVGALTDDYTLSGHQDYANYKSCPGEKTYPIIGEHLSSTLIQQEDDMAGVLKWARDAWRHNIRPRIFSDGTHDRPVRRDDLVYFADELGLLDLTRDDVEFLLDLRRYVEGQDSGPAFAREAIKHIREARD